MLPRDFMDEAQAVAAKGEVFFADSFSDGFTAGVYV
jgi:hypothetical protein